MLTTKKISPSTKRFDLQALILRIFTVNSNIADYLKNARAIHDAQKYSEIIKNCLKKSADNAIGKLNAEPLTCRRDNKCHSYTSTSHS